MSLNAMRISKSEIGRVANERDILDELLPLEGARVLELGCGNAANRRRTGPPASIAGAKLGRSADI